MVVWCSWSGCRHVFPGVGSVVGGFLGVVGGGIVGAIGGEAGVTAVYELLVPPSSDDRPSALAERTPAAREERESTQQTAASSMGPGRSSGSAPSALSVHQFEIEPATGIGNLTSPFEQFYSHPGLFWSGRLPEAYPGPSGMFHSGSLSNAMSVQGLSDTLGSSGVSSSNAHSSGSIAWCSPDVVINGVRIRPDDSRPVSMRRYSAAPARSCIVLWGMRCAWRQLWRCPDEES